MRNSSASVIGHCLTDSKFNFLEADGTFQELVQRDMTALRALDILAVTHAEDRTPNSDFLDRLCQHGEPFVIVKRYVRPDSSIRWVRNHVSLIRDGLAGARLVATIEAIDGPQDEPALIQIARRVLKRRTVRCGQFGEQIFSDIASDILVDLLVNEQAGRETCVSSACLASHVSATTGLRQIQRLEEKGMVTRFEDLRDKRRSLVKLTDHGRTQVTAMLQAIERAEMR